MCRPIARDIRHSPVTLTSKTSSNSASGTSRAGPWKQMPALLTRMSMRPCAATASSATRATSSRSVTSADTTVARRPVSSAMAAAASSLRAVSRATTTTSAPAWARAVAKARPRPRLAPVTSAVRPDRSNGFVIPAGYAWRRLPGRLSGPGAGARTSARPGLVDGGHLDVDQPGGEAESRTPSRRGRWAPCSPSSASTPRPSRW